MENPHKTAGDTVKQSSPNDYPYQGHTDNTHQTQNQIPQPRSIRWSWVFLANLTLETPLSVLNRHGETINPESIDSLGENTPRVSMTSRPMATRDEATYGEWAILERNGAGNPDACDMIIMDIPESACSPSRYMSFLRTFRSIVESDDLTRNKRHKIEQWLGGETWNDVLVWWGGEAAFINRAIPTFLDHLVEQGASKKVTDQLDILGIDNRMALTRLMNGKLGLDLQKDIKGVSKKTTEVLSLFSVHDQLMQSVNSGLEMTDPAIKDDIFRQLEDPYIQVIY